MYVLIIIYIPRGLIPHTLSCLIHSNETYFYFNKDVYWSATNLTRWISQYIMYISWYNYSNYLSSVTIISIKANCWIWWFYNKSVWWTSEGRHTWVQECPRYRFSWNWRKWNWINDHGWMNIVMNVQWKINNFCTIPCSCYSR